MDDQDINQILIVTQKPRRILSKHPQGDRTSGSHQSRNKMTADLAQTINDGLYYYEQVREYFLLLNIILLLVQQDLLSQHKDSSYVSRSKEMASYCKVGLISKEEFANQKAATGSALDQESSEEELFFQMEGDHLQQQLSHSLPTTLEHDQKTSSAANTGHTRHRQKQRIGKDNKRARFYPIIAKDNEDLTVSLKKLYSFLLLPYKYSTIYSLLLLGDFISHMLCGMMR